MNMQGHISSIYSCLFVLSSFYGAGLKKKMDLLAVSPEISVSERMVLGNLYSYKRVLRSCT
jgi:hypothetical protein